MANCPKCGTGIPKGSQFCGGCGTAVTQLGGDTDEDQNKSVLGSILFWGITFAVIALGTFLIDKYI
ncbi:MAG: zinc-ribbon domain-containing protein [Dehalococcoidia bacterium]|nr:MAG: zinc-ribbon domain-containing protein [Dehalococcoidia bacterium]